MKRMVGPSERAGNSLPFAGVCYALEVADDWVDKLPFIQLTGLQPCSSLGNRLICIVEFSRKTLLVLP